MRLYEFLFFVLVASLVNGCANGQLQTTGREVPSTKSLPTTSDHPISRLVVVAVQSKGFSAAKAVSLAEESLCEKGYTIASRRDLDRVLLEQRIQASDLTEKVNAVKIGEILNVDAIFIIQPTSMEVTKTDRGQEILTRLSVSGRLIDAQYGNIIWIKNVESNRGGLFGLPFVVLDQLVGGQDDITTHLTKEILLAFPMRKP
jgi:hypothetical protein